MSEEMNTNYDVKESPQVIRAKMPTGWIATGLVAVVGSWFGMAVYMNHRISDLEKGFQSEQSKVLASIGVNNDGLTNQLKETGSVLAKGLLDLTEKEVNRHDQLQTVIKTSQKELAAVFSDQQASQIKTISNIVSALGETQKSNNQSVIAAIEDSKQSLESLVSSGISQQDARLNTLATAIDQLPTDDGEKSKIIHAQLTAMSNRIQEFQEQLVDSKSSIDELNQALPQWKNEAANDYKVLNTKVSDFEGKLVKHLQMVQEQVAAVQHNMDQSSENLLKTLYLTSEGLEGTKYELKSEVETMKQSAKDDFNRLNQSIHSITNSLDEIKSDLSMDSVDTTSLHPENINHMIDSVQTFSSRTIGLHQELQSHVDEVKAWLKNADSGAPIDRGFFEKLITDYQQYLDANHMQIDSLLASLQGVKESNTEIVKDTEVVESNNEGEEQQTALHPEERTEGEVGVSLY